MPDLAEIRLRLADIQEYLESVETCHVCGGSLHLEDVEPAHCENCSWNCDDHGEPHCEPMYVKHDKAKRALSALLAALDATAQKEDGETCSDCPPAGYPTDKTRCDECQRRAQKEDGER